MDSAHHTAYAIRMRQTNRRKGLKTITIKHRWTRAVLFACDVDGDDPQPIRTAVTRAVLADADLARAYLAGANLAGADLAGANLAGARGMDPNAPRIDPPEPYQRIIGADAQRRRALRYREQHPEVPVVENLDKRILEVVESGAGKLDMSSWHSCKTTHCRAGWAVHLAGEAGFELERKLGAQHAGAAIYRASTGRVPHFFANNVNAMADIRRCAAEAEATAP